MENGKRRGGFTLWFTGLSGAGKTTIAEIVERELRMRHGKIEVLDGDIVQDEPLQGPRLQPRGPGHERAAGSGSWRTFSRATTSA